MNKKQHRLLSILALSLLAFSIYLNFFHKEHDILNQQKILHSGQTADPRTTSFIPN